MDHFSDLMIKETRSGHFKGISFFSGEKSVKKSFYLEDFRFKNFSCKILFVARDPAKNPEIMFSNEKRGIFLHSFQ